METHIAKQEKAVLMKNGAVVWVDLPTAEKVESHLASQSGHTFIRLKEYDMTINSAEIEGVYTPAQYADVQKSQNGYWQCELKGWHFKKEKCNCIEEKARMAREEKQRKQFEDMQQEEKTPEEKEKTYEALRKGKEILYIKGVFGGGGEVRESTLKEWEKKNGPVPKERRSQLKITKG
jgi:hypothetical protein